MSQLRSRAALLAAGTVLASMTIATYAVAPSMASPAPPAVAPTTDAEKGVTVRGAVGDPGPVSRGALQDFRQREVRSRYQTSGGPQSHVYTGPLLLDVLNSVQPDFSADPHDMLRYAILVEASDGFLATLAWGEIQPDLADKTVIVALTEDGETLDRPRLVVPDDTHGARQVYDVATILLLRLSPELADGTAGQVLGRAPGHEGH